MSVIKPQYPNVPNVPGVPSLIRRAGAAIAVVEPLTTDAFALMTALGANLREWDLLDDSGASMFGDAVDTVLGAEIRWQSNVPDYPIEGGDFRNYNKVQTPTRVRLEAAKAGEPGEIAALLSLIEDLRVTTALHTITSPEKLYTNMNLVGAGVSRSTETGPRKAIAMLEFQEIRPTGTIGFSNTRSESGAATADTGAVQPSAPTKSQTESATEAT